MEGLADRFQVVAIDQRGYNRSDKPAGVVSYDRRLLVGDVIAVIKHLGKDNAIIVGTMGSIRHDRHHLPAFGLYRLETASPAEPARHVGDRDSRDGL